MRLNILQDFDAPEWVKEAMFLFPINYIKPNNLYSVNRLILIERNGIYQLVKV